MPRSGKNKYDPQAVADAADLTKNGVGEETARLREERRSRIGANHHRTHALRSADMARISSMLLHGASVEEIAYDLGMDKKTVLLDIQQLNSLWVKQVAENAESFRALQLSKLMKIEAMALESFHESKEKTVTDRTVHPDGGISNSVKTFNTAGEPAFLGVAKDCIKQQVSLLGLDGKETSTKSFDKEAFLDAVAEKIAEVKMAATAIPTAAAELKQVEKDAADAGSPFA